MKRSLLTPLALMVAGIALTVVGTQLRAGDSESVPQACLDAIDEAYEYAEISIDYAEVTQDWIRIVGQMQNQVPLESINEQMVELNTRMEVLTDRLDGVTFKDDADTCTAIAKGDK